eukprot:1156014-Pelagomonas_calceolata.AAC.5
MPGRVKGTVAADCSARVLEWLCFWMLISVDQLPMKDSASYIMVTTTTTVIIFVIIVFDPDAAGPAATQHSQQLYGQVDQCHRESFCSRDLICYDFVQVD